MLKDYNCFGADNVFQFKVAQKHTDTVRLRQSMWNKNCGNVKSATFTFYSLKCNTCPHCVKERFCSVTIFQYRNVVGKMNLILYLAKFVGIVTIIWDKFPKKHCTVQTIVTYRESVHCDASSTI